MNNDPLTERDLRARLSVPPTFDIGHHLRELARVLLPATLGALIVAGVAYTLVSAQPAEYQNSVTAKIDSGAMMAGLNDATLTTLAPPFVALSKSEAVLADVAKRAEIDTPPQELAKDIDVAVQVSPSLVEVTSRASTPERAIALSSAVVSALDSAIVNIWNDRVIKDVKDLQWSASQAASKMVGLDPDSPEYLVLHSDFDSQLERAKQLQSTPPTRIVLLSQSDEAEKVAPLPLQQTLVAFVASLLVLAETLAFLNGRVGRRTGMAWVRRQAHRHGYAVTSADASARGWPIDTQVLVNKIARQGDGVLVLRSATPAAFAFVESSLGSGATDDAPVSGPGRHSAAATSAGVPVVRSVDSDWWREPELVDRSLAIVVIDARTTGRKAWKTTFTALDRYGSAVQLVSLRGNAPARGEDRVEPAAGPVAAGPPAVEPVAAVSVEDAAAV